MNAGRGTVVLIFKKILGIKWNEPFPLTNEMR